MVTCPYCDSDKKPRGLKNHVRMSGGEHGEPGTIPDDFDARLQTDDDDDDDRDASGGVEASDEVTTVTPDELREVHDADAEAAEDDDSGDDGGDYPFDPSDDDAIRLEGGEVMDIRKDGEVYPGVEADDGDYLLRTDKGPVLYDSGDDELYEVLTV